MQDKVRGAEQYLSLLHRASLVAVSLTLAQPLVCRTFCGILQIIFHSYEYCAKPLMSGPVAGSSIKLQHTSNRRWGRDARRLNRVRQHKITTKRARKYNRCVCVCVYMQLQIIVLILFPASLCTHRSGLLTTSTCPCASCSSSSRSRFQMPPRDISPYPSRIQHTQTHTHTHINQSAYL